MKKQQLFENRGFVWNEAYREFGTDVYYVAPQYGIFRLDEQSIGALNNRVHEVFEEMTGGKYLDISKYFTPNYFRAIDTDLTLLHGVLDDLDGESRLYFEVPHFRFGGSALRGKSIASLTNNPPKKDESYEIRVFPSIEFVDLYLWHLRKIKEIYHLTKKRTFHYESLSTGEVVVTQLVPKPEDARICMPLIELFRNGINVDGKEVFMAPPPVRENLLSMIQDDIRTFGGAYNWTTDWKSSEIDVETYNSFFRKYGSSSPNRKLVLV